MENLAIAPLAPYLDEFKYASAYQKGFSSTLRSVRFLGANAETAEEVAQDAWARGWQFRKQLLCPDHVGAWVNVIARNLYHSLIRIEKRFLQLEDFAASSSMLDNVDASNLLKNCSEPDERMLRLYYIEGFSTQEIAEKERLAPTSVRVRLMRIRRRLRDSVVLPPVQPGAVHQHLV